MKDISKKIRDDPFWQRVSKLVERMYGKVDQLIVDHPNEEWSTAVKLRSSVIDSLFYVSQVVGRMNNDGNKFDLNSARRSLFSMQSMYIFITKQKFLELEPEIIVEIDQIIVEIDKMIDESILEYEKNQKKDLEPWLEKYRLWQKMQD